MMDGQTTVSSAKYLRLKKTSPLSINRRLHQPNHFNNKAIAETIQIVTDSRQQFIRAETRTFLNIGKEKGENDCFADLQTRG
jgi:hypothetical protein